MANRLPPAPTIPKHSFPPIAAISPYQCPSVRISGPKRTVPPLHTNPASLSPNPHPSAAPNHSNQTHPFPLFPLPHFPSHTHSSSLPQSPVFSTLYLAPSPSKKADWPKNRPRQLTSNMHTSTHANFCNHNKQSGPTASWVSNVAKLEIPGWR